MPWKQGVGTFTCAREGERERERETVSTLCRFEPVIVLIMLAGMACQTYLLPHVTNDFIMPLSGSGTLCLATSSTSMLLWSHFPLGLSNFCQMLLQIAQKFHSEKFDLRLRSFENPFDKNAW